MSGLEKTAIQNLFPDNTSGLITPAIQRQGIDSLIPSNFVIVEQASDLPATLVDNTAYLIRGNITIASPITLGANNVILGIDPLQFLVTYTGTGAMFTGTNTNVAIKDLAFSLGTQSLFSISGAGSNIAVSRVFVVTCASFGAINGLNQGSFRSVEINQATAFGLQVRGSVGRLTLTSFSFSDVQAGDCLDLNTATIGELAVFGCRFATTLTANGVNATGTTITVQALITTSIFLNVTPLVAVAPSTVRWVFAGNVGVQNSETTGWVTTRSNATVTVCTLNTPTPILATFSDGGSSRFSVSAAGVATYNGVRVVSLQISATISGFKDGPGNNVTYEFSLRKNGAVIPNVNVGRTFDAGGDRGNVSLVGIVSADPGDTFQMYIENQTDNDDFTVEDLTLVLFGDA